MLHSKLNCFNSPWFLFSLSLQSSRVHITRAVLEQFLSFAKYLDGLTHGAPLLKQLCDHVLFNAAIWIHTPAKVGTERERVSVSPDQLYRLDTHTSTNMSPAQPGPYCSVQIL